MDLILLDISLPDGDGFQYCARLQQDDHTRHLPVILLTGKTGVNNKVLGFSVGADDYLEKPFDARELRARVESRLKKLRAQKQTHDVYVRGELQINAENHTVSLKELGATRDIELTPIEFKLLQYFARQEGRTLSRDQLLTAVWGQNVAITDRTVDKHISCLRQKLGHCGTYIETVPGFGYIFSPLARDKKSA